MTKTVFLGAILAAVFVAVIGFTYTESFKKTADAEKPSGLTERVSVTTDIGYAPLSPPNPGLQVSVLLDVTGSGTLKDVHVAATLPCGGVGTAPSGGISIVTGIAGVTIPPGTTIIGTAADNTGFPGAIFGTCVFHGTVSGITSGDTDVVVLNPGGLPLPIGSIV